MELDLDQCVARVPEGPEFDRVLRMLEEVFPGAAATFRAVREGQRTLHRWTAHALYCGDRLVGNVSTVEREVWCAGEVRPVVGIGSVGTPKPYRRQGVARKLMTQVLAEVDARGAASALWTGVPQVYAGHGYRPVRQRRGVLETEALVGLAPGGEVHEVSEPDAATLQAMADLYAGLYPEYDGKVVRDEAYWSEVVAARLRASRGAGVLLHSQDGGLAGYAHVNVGGKRLGLNELACAPDAQGVMAALLTAAARAGLREGLQDTVLALPDVHPAWPLLQDRGVAVREPDRPADNFMVRGPGGGELGPYARMHWCVVDSF